jgi:SAM-dependent methyltransferase
VQLPRRLVFGEMAERYDRHRPDYPPDLVQELIDRSGIERGEGRALEVGAGTGKATRLFAHRGIPVLAVEPSAEMAELARRNLGDHPEVEIVRSDFENFDPGGERFPLLYSAQAWHWVQPGVRTRLARAALEDDGLLAPFWNQDAWTASPLRDAVAEIYERVVPEMPPENSWHPAFAPEGDPWLEEISAAPEFGDPEVRLFEWNRDFTGEGYVELLATYSQIHMLDEAVRTRLLAEIRDAIDQRGGTLTMPIVTRLGTARAA